MTLSRWLWARMRGSTTAAVRLFRALVMLGILALLVTACSKPTGTITGHLYRVGGPPPGAPSPMPGTIYVSGRDSPVTAGSDGSFSVVAPPGTYRLSGRSLDGGLCRARRTVTVQAGARVKMDVICDIP